ncbi:MAG: hypothetical protein A3H27_13375 [Acidobacteria bacterium RIFCSPLOWO2_02_FULL_59_13]|nr:MAG: hypothetical protein A3H27_13375 [Acidobacteria bacterium RIFCSPLOWO2_02_FULL_59_13]
MEKRVIEGERAIPVHGQPTIVAEQTKVRSTNPATPVAAMGHYPFYVAPGQTFSQRIAIVVLVGNQPFGFLPRPAPRRGPDRGIPPPFNHVIRDSNPTFQDKSILWSTECNSF